MDARRRRVRPRAAPPARTRPMPSAIASSSGSGPSDAPVRGSSVAVTSATTPRFPPPQRAVIVYVPGPAARPDDRDAVEVTGRVDMHEGRARSRTVRVPGERSGDQRDGARNLAPGRALDQHVTRHRDSASDQNGIRGRDNRYRARWTCAQQRECCRHATPTPTPTPTGSAAPSQPPPSWAGSP